MGLFWGFFLGSIDLCVSVVLISILLKCLLLTSFFKFSTYSANHIFPAEESLYTGRTHLFWVMAYFYRFIKYIFLNQTLLGIQDKWVSKTDTVLTYLSFNPAKLWTRHCRWVLPPHLWQGPIYSPKTVSVPRFYQIYLRFPPIFTLSFLGHLCSNWKKIIGALILKNHNSFLWRPECGNYILNDLSRRQKILPLISAKLYIFYVSSHTDHKNICFNTSKTGLIKIKNLCSSKDTLGREWKDKLKSWRRCFPIYALHTHTNT